MKDIVQRLRAHADVDDDECANEIEKFKALNSELRRFVDFVNLWCHRGPPHGGPGNEAQCLDAIRNHPTARAALSPV